MATWSGWVGLGEMTGFGVVHPLPGIWDDLAVNIAVTLPIGVEAYAVYALSVATSPRRLPPQVRRFAWASSLASLLIGMGGQVAYHVMQSVGWTKAPTWVVAAVACLPVVVLGVAAVLWHLESAVEHGEKGSWSWLPGSSVPRSGRAAQPAGSAAGGSSSGAGVAGASRVSGTSVGTDGGSPSTAASTAGPSGLSLVPTRGDGPRAAAVAAARSFRAEHGRLPSLGELVGMGVTASTAKRALREMRGAA